MSRFSERRQHLDLAEDWEGLKWDDCDEFIKPYAASFAQTAPEPGRSVKGADVVAVRRGRGRAPVLLVGEFKDFANPTIPQRERLEKAKQATSPQVMGDVIAKVIDTLCGASFAHDDRDGRSAELESWRRAVGAPAPRVVVLLAVELPSAAGPAALAWNTELKRRLRWLGPRATVVVTTASHPVSGYGMSYSVT